MKDNQIKSTITGFNQDGTKRIIRVWGAYNYSQGVKLMQDLEKHNFKSAPTS